MIRGNSITASRASRSRNFAGRFVMSRKIKAALGVQRVIDLRAAVGGLTKRFKKRAQFFRGFPQAGCEGERARIQTLAMPSNFDDSTPHIRDFYLRRETRRYIMKCLEWFFVRAGGGRDGTSNDGTTDNR